jgi:DNA polymerase-3 subunit epsilon
MTSAWHEGRLVAFDVETTGVAYEHDRIVTAAISVIAEKGEDEKRGTEHHTWLLDPGVEISEGATEVHGISTEHAREHGQPAAEGIREIVERLAAELKAGAAVVAFNARFDLTMLDREARRHDVVPLVERGSPLWVVDPFVLDKHVDRYRRGKRTLSVVCEVYDVVLEDAHAAGADALAAARVAWRMGQRVPTLRDMPLPQLHAAQVEWAAVQAASLEEYFRRQGKDERCEPAWPVVPYRDQSELAA